MSQQSISAKLKAEVMNCIKIAHGHCRTQALAGIIA